jgi:two-component system LytT family sensor kinase
MTEITNWRFSLRQAIYLALTVLAIYYPITIYVNIPRERILEASTFLIYPTLFNFIFYVLLILATDRLIDWSEKIAGKKIITEFSFSTLLLSIPFAVLVTFFGHLIITFILRPSEQDIKNGLMAEMTPQQFETFRRTNNGLTLMTVLGILYLIINRKANIQMKDLEVEAQRLVKEHALAQYEALKNQVSPHFLFNSLSILSSLVRVNPELSEQFIEQLSKAYRYILEQKDKDSISLKTELDFILSYAFLLKIRFAKKFDLKISIKDSDAETYLIAPLTLQLLVENAVKHNRMSSKDPLHVSILIENNYLIVLNPIRTRNENDRAVSTGIGLSNIKNRYALLTSQPVEVSTNHGTFIVKIPLI